MMIFWLSMTTILIVLMFTFTNILLHFPFLLLVLHLWYLLLSHSIANHIKFRKTIIWILGDSFGIFGIIYIRYCHIISRVFIFILRDVFRKFAAVQFTVKKSLIVLWCKNLLQFLMSLNNKWRLVIIILIRIFQIV